MTTEKDETQARVTQHALNRAGQYAMATGLISGTGVMMATRSSPWFRSRLGVSGKTALVVMPTLGVFSAIAENTILAGVRNPLATTGDLATDTHITRPQKKTLSWYHHMGNWIYDHPFRTIAITGIPSVGLIYLDQSRNPSIKISQKIMHTRLYGQGLVITILLSTMAFQDWMHEHGRFKEISSSD